MEKEEGWYRISNIEELDSPALLIYPDRVRRNIQTLLRMCGTPDRLRPHVKTHKTAELTRMLMEAGIRKFKCATIAEAEMLGTCGAPDVLLAYQPLGPKLERLITLIGKYPGTLFSCLVDNLETAEAMDATISPRGFRMSVYLDLNIGQDRTGIRPGEKAKDLYLAANKMKGIRPVGLHAYDGHLRDKDWNIRKKRCDEAFEAVRSLRRDLLETGLPVPVIVAGGSPTYSIHCRREDVECSPGTFVFWDRGYEELCPEQEFLPAALVLSRVISHPAPGKICTDLGHKSIAAENDISRRVFFLNGPNLRPSGQSEEHLVLETSFPEGHLPGEVLYGLPFHICPTIALYERAHTIVDGRASGEWRIVARDREITV
jgi:D-serine deaminase-like pyridoxal phosphate-dependent protein